ncbi:CLUMA_CG001887, isoform A [Clunio marinus]|uniref:CLUMA_CG001887, isoform A n=1 Tax=Clunio marinus TaxID=568069 RepID=A0A1J1HNQ6_9DIPT|nr:CLUMA_CG001887, isoform A [Clunio marinus]
MNYTALKEYLRLSSNELFAHQNKTMTNSRSKSPAQNKVRFVQDTKTKYKPNYKNYNTNLNQFRNYKHRQNSQERFIPNNVRRLNSAREQEFGSNIQERYHNDYADRTAVMNQPRPQTPPPQSKPPLQNYQRRQPQNTNENFQTQSQLNRYNFPPINQTPNYPMKQKLFSHSSSSFICKSMIRNGTQQSHYNDNAHWKKQEKLTADFCG